jgi:transposase InsO family protein
MPRAGPRKVQRYSLEFKLKAVKLSQFEGVLRGRVSAPKTVKVPPARDIKRLQSLQRAHALLQEEHALLQKLIRFHLRTKADVFAFIEEERTRFGVTRLCRLLRADGMRGRVARVYRPKAGTHRWFSRQPNHVRRTRATRPNQIWVGDVTYLGVGGRWWYLIAVLDQCSRRVLSCGSRPPGTRA